MKANVIYTTTDQNQGLQTIEFAGRYMQEAYELFENILTEDEISDYLERNHSWADIMYQDGVCCAVAAEDALTCHNASMVMIKLDKEEYKEIYDNAQCWFDIN